MPLDEFSDVCDLAGKVEMIEPHLANGNLGVGPTVGVVFARISRLRWRRCRGTSDKLVLQGETREQVLDSVFNGVRGILVRLVHRCSLFTTLHAFGDQPACMG